MDFNLSKKRARSHSIEAEEPPNKKLCASGPGPKISGMISSSHPELSMAENQVRMNIIAEEHRIAEQDISADNGFDDDFEAELEAAFNDGENEPVSHEKSLPPNASEDDARHNEAPDNDASDNDASDNDAPDNDASADHASEDKASECDVPLPETSEKRAVMARLESNSKAIVLEPNWQTGLQDADSNLVLAAEKSFTPPGSPASSSSKKLSTVSAGSSSRVLSSSPETPMTSIFDEASPSPPDSIRSTPKADNGRPSAAPKPLAKPRPKYVGPSFRERRPLTTEHRVMVRNAIDYTLRDLYQRTNIELGTMDTEKGNSELYDTSLESFAYQYARAQHRFKQYHESKDLKAGINTTTKKYRKRMDRRFEEFDLLCEVEGPWRTGFDDWKPPGASQAGGTIDFSSD